VDLEEIVEVSDNEIAYLKKQTNELYSQLQAADRDH